MDKITTVGSCPKCNAESPAIDYSHPEHDGDCMHWYGTCQKCNTPVKEVYEVTYLHTEIVEETETK